MNQVLLISLLIFRCSIVHAQDDRAYRVLPATFNADKSNQMMRAYQRRQVHVALDRRLDELEAALDSPEAIAAYQKKRREFPRWSLGRMPQPTPLNAKVTAAIDEDGFRIENILFESQPGFHVTANLYRVQSKNSNEA